MRAGREHGLVSARAAGSGPDRVWAPDAFVFGVLRWHNDNTLYPLEKWLQDRSWAHQACVAGIFWEHGRVALLKPIQALALLALLVHYARGGARRETVPGTCALALTVFLVLNPMVWGYLHFPAPVAALVGLA